MTIEIGGPSSGDGGGDNGRNVAKGFGPPPAFLTKTFHMVNDPNSNSIISWGKLGDSFIIWDHIKFSVEILPNYFRHNNFSSFVYQLNNYGFRKIGVDNQWEYISPYFQEGKPHLLYNMKRRSLQNSTPRRQKDTHETLNKSIDESLQEIKKLKKHQSDIELNIVKLRQKATALEATSMKLVAQWAKACELIVMRRDKAAAIAEIPAQESEENQENEVVKEEAEKQPVVLSSAAAGDESESAAMIGEYSVRLDDVKKRLFGDDEACEDEAANRNAMAQDFEEWLIQSSTTLW
ncbi:heat stress transcription factor A-7a-like [Salvia divinorum]|uniref:Heat stress transcription factor A-7a-like n=1 Tax=Salvia divinorum TaxID=28513 RepID=A0ABD1I1V9_SALDI